MAAFETDPEIESAVERLKAAFHTPERGTLITWDAIESVIGRHREDRGGWTIIGKFRKWLRRGHMIVTLPETMTGLRLLTDKEAVTEIPELRQRKAVRQLSRGARELGAVRVENLSERERLILGRQTQSIVNERRNLRRALRSGADIAKESEAVRRPPPQPVTRVEPKRQERSGRRMLLPK